MGCCSLIMGERFPASRRHKLKSSSETTIGPAVVLVGGDLLAIVHLVPGKSYRQADTQHRKLTARHGSQSLRLSSKWPDGGVGGTG